MKKVIMKAGYTLRVTSWENDGDYKKTSDIHTTDKAMLDGYVAVCKYLTETNNKDSIANADSVAEEANVRMNEILQKHPVLKTVPVDEDIHPVVGISHILVGWSEWYITRVCEKYEVYYTEQDLEVEVL